MGGPFARRFLRWRQLLYPDGQEVEQSEVEKNLVLLRFGHKILSSNELSEFERY
jgi:hypothetical protein